MTYRSTQRLAPAYSLAEFDEAMRARNVNVSELARLTQRSRTSMSLIRSGRQVPTVETAVAIERALAVDHGALFDFGDDAAAAGAR